MVKVATRLVDASIRKATDQFSIDLGPNMPRVLCNAQLVEQIIVNLVLNACQALPDRKARIKISTRSNPATQDVICMVQDEGVGIAKEHLSRIFDPFFTTKRDRGGTGLGLSVSLTIIKYYNGTLEFESQPGRGTIATLTLPVAPKEATS
jgi:polar amino acid transport system substrate-binding protein